MSIPYTVYCQLQLEYSKTHITAISPAPNVLTSSLSVPLASSPAPSVSSDRRSRTSPQWTALRESEGQKRFEMERDRAEKAPTISPHFSTVPRKWVSDSTQKSLFIFPSFSCPPFSADVAFSFHSLTSLYPPFSFYNLSSFSLRKQNIFLLMT